MMFHAALVQMFTRRPRGRFKPVSVLVVLQTYIIIIIIIIYRHYCCFYYYYYSVPIKINANLDETFRPDLLYNKILITQRRDNADRCPQWNRIVNITVTTTRGGSDRIHLYQTFL